MKSKIRQAGSQDRSRLVDLEREFWREEYESIAPPHRAFHPGPDCEPGMPGILEDENRRVFVAEQDGEIVGFVETLLRPYKFGSTSVSQGILAKVFVSAHHRGQGIARQLVAKAKEWFEGQGCEYMGTVVFVSNPVKDIYKHLGFEPFSLNLKQKLENAQQAPEADAS